MRKITTILALICGLFFINACGDDEDDNLPFEGDTEQYSQFEEGEIATREFLVNGEVVVSMEDEVVNFGTKEVPALFFVHKQTQTMTDGYEEVFFPIYREKLIHFISQWRTLFASSIGPATADNSRAFIHFLNFLLTNKLDGGLLLKVIEEQNNDDDVLLLVKTAGTVVTKSGAGSGNANDLLLWLHDNGVSATELIQAIEKTGMTVDAFLNEMYVRDGGFHSLQSIQTKGVVGDVVSIFKGIIQIKDLWVDFVNNNGPVVNMESNYVSFLNSEDTNPDNYVGGVTRSTDTYSLRYKVSKKWFAEASYHMEVTHGATHQTISGLYIKHCNLICENAKAGGPLFSVNGGVSYSLPVNIGKPNTPPIPQMNGKVSIDYGDCCCCHYFSYLNFSITGDNGFKQTGFSTGRKD